MPVSVSGLIADRVARFVAFASRTHSPYQAATIRIGYGFFFAFYLLQEWPNRRVLFGDLSPWSFDIAKAFATDTHSFTVLAWSGGRWWFELVYHGAIAAAVLLMLGWRTRATAVLFLVGVLSVENRSPFVGDAGDNIIRIMAIYLAFTRCGQVCSLDARRRRLHPREPRHDRAGVVMWLALGLPLLWMSIVNWAGWLGVFWVMWSVQGLWFAAHRWFPRHAARSLLDSGSAMLHNCAMLVIAVQVCFIYGSAGLYKSQGSKWQDGSAVYYAMHVDLFRPWPWLNDLLTANMLVIFLLSYGTVIMQISFPFTLMYRRVKNVLLAVMMLEHVGIAVLLGIPFLSLAMIVSDAVFLPTAFLIWVGNRSTSLAGRMRKRRGTHARTGPADGIVTAR
ncbi:HTTM domain-containing protein [Actinacidiphila oryziradicis]|uniref:HTTM domain-containing protein n=1 Tax=Actinacidiphila oryziradicis TaxID=2571141 RepID=A0A4U0RNZ0_9ACTN|nr:HTTM domain-containing protein [Actinacidiphila oryziradicis]